MSPLVALLIAKVVLTTLFVTVPLLDGDTGRIWDMTDLVIETRVLRRLGYGFVVLTLCDIVGLFEALNGRFPGNIVLIGVATNGAAVIALFGLAILPTITVLLGALAVLLTTASVFPKSATARIRRHP